MEQPPSVDPLYAVKTQSTVNQILLLRYTVVCKRSTTTSQKYVPGTFLMIGSMHHSGSAGRRRCALCPQQKI